MVPTHTHLRIDRRLCGSPIEVAPGQAVVELLLTPTMVADDRGLVHGGFVFGLADYAAMVAVDDPHVVLGAAEVRFLAPCVVGERLIASASIEREEGARRWVAVKVDRQLGNGNSEVVFTGEFTCIVLTRHVLDSATGPPR